MTSDDNNTPLDNNLSLEDMVNSSRIIFLLGLLITILSGSGLMYVDVQVLNIVFDIIFSVLFVVGVILILVSFVIMSIVSDEIKAIKRVEEKKREFKYFYDIVRREEENEKQN